jgi:hypothetical protein
MEELCTLNRAQHFTFPHNNCDELSTDELIRQWYAPDYYCHYLVTHIHTMPNDALKTLKIFDWFGELGAAYMRLKFLLEVCDPVQLERKKQTLPKVLKPNTVWHQPSLNKVLEYTDYEAYLKLNMFCNSVFIGILNGIKTQTPPAKELLAAVQSLNNQLPVIRSTPLGQFNWSSTTPTHLVAYPYFTFVLRAYQVVFQACAELSFEH